MQNTALITGASSGIGLELAREHARRGGDLVLVARSQDSLLAIKEELETQSGIHCEVIIADLSLSGEPQRIFSILQQKGIEVDILINNAGFGARGLFHEVDMSTHSSMVDLNIKALMELTNLLVPDMIRKGSGRILNIASSAAYLPGPLQAVYYASKAFVLSFSLALSEELREHGITVTASCPGPVSTNFFKTANIRASLLTRSAQSASKVARDAYRAMIRGRRVIISTPMLRLLPLVTPFSNTRLLLKVSRKAMEL